MQEILTFVILKATSTDRQTRRLHAPVPGKPIIANSGLNIANRRINFIPRLDSVPESTIKNNLGINYVLNLTHLARTINSLIGRKSLSKQTKWRTYCFRKTRKKVPTSRNWPRPTNSRRTSQKI